MKVFIWGTGVMAEDYLKKREIDIDDIVGFIESKRTKTIYAGKKVYEPQEIPKGSFDYILVCVKHVAREIYQLCKKIDLDIDKLIFMNNWEWPDGSPWEWPDDDFSEPPKCCRKIIDNDIDMANLFPQFYEAYIKETEIMAQRYTIVLKNGYDLCEEDSPMSRKEFQTRNYQTDYFRYRTFELLANEIIRNNVKGDVAELGVFRGQFSKLISTKFPNHKIYLFDTFESFNGDEFDAELQAGRVPEYLFDGHKNTSVQLVNDKMPYPEKCIIRKGCFPETASGLEREKFAFVSIDVDLEKSILEGLRFFYPRLSSGGAIFVHDYNNRFLEGVKIAVDVYEKEIGTVLPKVPLADEGGTLVLLKS